MEQAKKPKRDISGWLVLDKPYDMTSTQAVGKVRWLFGAKKGGHAGTLDPLATGILPIALGEATKTVMNVQDGEKLYRFTVKWGAQTATDDAEGDVVATSDVRPSPEAINALLPRFTGDIMQAPPAFSAIKVAGERAYDLARAGEAVELEPRPVTIESFVLTSHDGESSTFEVACQKGTYVRSLARDLALALDTRGHVIELHRAAVGPFTDAIAVNLAALEAAAPEDRDKLLLPVASALTGVPEVRLSAPEAAVVRNGNPVLLVGAGAPIELDEAWASCRGQAIAIGYVAQGQFKPRRVILG
ncbi:MAG TPA: tRNA pseudouridine(55) synthase TruB [Devosiaceae bacterium]|nr:tRNA pseudouridine(55) synthase TruB [Devosiaceae bacterium]